MKGQALYVAHRGKVTLRKCVRATKQGFWVEPMHAGNSPFYVPRERLASCAYGGTVFNVKRTVLDEEEAFRIARRQVQEYRIWIQQHTDVADALTRDLT